MTPGSLRLRLFIIILVPLTILALMIGIWRIDVAQSTASELFDRNLMFTALAISRDVARDDGDALSPDTQDLLNKTAGGPVRYHVYGPDGVLVTGYAVPPIPPGRLDRDTAFAYYDATYRDSIVRVLRIKDEASIDDLSGIFTITVWQDLNARNAFVWDLGLRSAGVMATLLIAVAILIWFGVSVGLKPLTDLEDAISRRSPEDLSPIKRPVPVEALGIVSQLNTLLDRIRITFDAQAAFVSDAAHQLRNPLAGMRALGESIQSAPNLQAAQARAGDLVTAAARAADLANRLLTLERARAETGTSGFSVVNLRSLVHETVSDMMEAAKVQPVEIVTVADEIGDHLVDPLMLRELLTNLIDNALVHGGSGLSEITVRLSASRGYFTLTVENDGASIEVEHIPVILARFGQLDIGAGSGLGLSIADAVAKRHGGELTVDPRHTGFSVTISIPMVEQRKAV